MIEDRRYIGSEIYPQIITDNIFIQANTVRENRRTTKSYIVDSSNKPFVYTVKCACYGTSMIHRTDRRAKNSEQWHCGSEKCGARIYMKIEELKKIVADLINEIIAEPALAEQKIDETEIPLEIKIMEREINRMLEQKDLNKEEIQNKILECATQKYEYFTGKAHITERLKADLKKTSPLSDFSMDIFIKTVSAVLIDENAKISIVLKNGNIVTEKSDEIGNNST